MNESGEGWYNSYSSDGCALNRNFIKSKFDLGGNISYHLVRVLW
jgi:hypothetical protein